MAKRNRFWDGRGSGDDGGPSAVVKAAYITGACAVLAAVIGVVLVAILNSGGNSGASGKNARQVTLPTTPGGGPTGTGPTTPQRAPERLVIDNTRVLNGPPPAGHHTKVRAAAVELQLRNIGDTTSDLTGARFVVKKFTVMPAKTCGVAFFSQRVTERYDVQLPLAASPGDSVTKDLHQVVKPNGTDRFRFDLGLDDPHERALNGPNGTGASRVYQLAIELLHDREAEPVKADTVLVAIPWPNPGAMLPATSAGLSEKRRRANEECARHNVAALRTAARAGGKTSSDLQDLVSDPRKSICSHKGTRIGLCE